MGARKPQVPGYELENNLVINGREFLRPHPIINIDGKNHTVEIEVINDSDINQDMGSGPHSIQIQGSCNLEEANFIDALTDQPNANTVEAAIELETHSRNWTCLVESSVTRPAGLDEPDLQSKTYYFTLECKTVRNNKPGLQAPKPSPIFQEENDPFSDEAKEENERLGDIISGIPKAPDIGQSPGG
jgi:hypothetical protein